jgi:MFS family permease
LPLLFAIGFLAMGTFVTVYNYIGFRLVQAPYSLNQTELGLIFTVYVFGIAASWIAGLLGDRFGHFVVLPAGIALSMAGVAMTLSASLPLIILGIVLLTSGFFVAHSVASAWSAGLRAAPRAMPRRSTCCPITSAPASPARWRLLLGRRRLECGGGLHADAAGTRHDRSTCLPLARR